MTEPVKGVLPGSSFDTALWLDRHGAALRQFFRRRIDPGDVDDLVQEVLLKLQTTIGDAEVADADRYLFSVARSVLVDRYRSDRARDLGAYEHYASIDGIADPLSPERIVLARDAYAQARTAVRNLPPRARMAFEYHRFEHMTYKEIAARMQISRESVKELVHRALTTIVADLRRSELHDG